MVDIWGVESISRLKKEASVHSFTVVALETQSMKRWIVSKDLWWFACIQCSSCHFELSPKVMLGICERLGKDDLSIMELCMLWIWIVDRHTVGKTWRKLIAYKIIVLGKFLDYSKWLVWITKEGLSNFCTIINCPVWCSSILERPLPSAP